MTPHIDPTMIAFVVTDLALLLTNLSKTLFYSPEIQSE